MDGLRVRSTEALFLGPETKVKPPFRAGHLGTQNVTDSKEG